MKKDMPFLWGTAQAKAFAALQNALMTSPVLLLPDYNRPFTLIMDASNYATGAILEQDDAFGQSHLVAYYSKSLQLAEQNYKIHDKELLAIVQALKHFHHYLQGNVHQTKIFLDHMNLKYFTTKQTLTCCQAWWSILLGTYNYVIIPKPGKLNQADGLSRHLDHKERIASENVEQVLLDPRKFLLKPEQFHLQALHNMAIPTGMDEELQAALVKVVAKDNSTGLGQKLKELITSGPRQVTKGLQDWNYKNRLFLYKGLVYVPDNENVRHKIVQQFHDSIMGHPGQWKTIKLITQEYWWPRITEFIKVYIKGCATCQTTKIKPPVKVPLKPNEIPSGIWETITMDFIVNLPTSNGYDSILTVVDRHSKAIILAPCYKTITAEQTSQLLIDYVWKRMGFPLTIILDQGPQFAAQVTQELWRKLGIKQKLLTVFHPQTDGESKHVNQEIEQYLRICGNFQQNDWATLLPIIKFAHNAWLHCSTHKSPFKVWYGIHLTFKPPLQLQTRLQSVDECIQYLEEMHKEVTAALHLAA